MRILLASTTLLATGVLAGSVALGQSEEAKPPAAAGLDRPDVGVRELRQQLRAAEQVPPAAKGLRKFELAKDRDRYGDFYDFGYWSGTSYAGQENLPPGYWVYLAPNWYIFGDAV